MVKLVYLVLIRYHRIIPVNLPTSLLGKFESVETVWTDETCGQFIENPNKFFEFSGYQEGVSRILNNLDLSHHKNSNKKIKIIIANDTIFTGHIRWLANFVIFHFLSSQLKLSNLTAMCTGLSHSINSDINYCAQISSYISSWLFMIEGTYSDLIKLTFYDRSLELNDFSNKFFNTLPMPYRRSVDEWLRPSHFLKGWYQALPGRQLPQATIDRKRFTIYLEHTLPHRLKESGFEVVCLSQRLGPLQKTLLSLLRFMDRFYVNLLKLRFRLLAKFFSLD